MIFTQSFSICSYRTKKYIRCFFVCTSIGLVLISFFALADRLSDRYSGSCRCCNGQKMLDLFVSTYMYNYRYVRVTSSSTSLSTWIEGCERGEGEMGRKGKVRKRVGYLVATAIANSTLGNLVIFLVAAAIPAAMAVVSNTLALICPARDFVTRVTPS